MLSNDQINKLPERIYQRLNDINTELLISIGKTLKKTGELIPKDIHQLSRLYDFGADMNRIINKLSEVSAKNIAEIYEIFDVVAKENYAFAEIFYKAKGMERIPYSKNEKLKDYVRSMAKQTANEYVNLTQHTAFAVFDKGGKSIAPFFESNKNKAATSLSDTYIKTVDYVITKAQMGAIDYNSAVREAVEALSHSGIRTVDYATGYSRRLDTAVRQNILWGIKQCNQNIADFIGEEFGADGYEISYHSHPRPTHADMGGKQYAIGKGRTVNGVYYPSFEEEAEPLLSEFNCLHFKFPILLGISQPAYSKAQLAEFKANDKKKFEFEGKSYSMYEGTQLQRKIETAIRYEKDLAVTAKAAGDVELRRQAQGKLNQLTNKYAELSEVSGLPTKIERMQVKGFRSVKLPEKALTEEGRSGIINHSGLAAKIGDKYTPMHEEPKLLKVIDYNNKKAVMDEIKAFEETAVTETIETACVITKDGEVWKCFGIEDRVFPDYDLGDKLHGAYVSHNHPMSVTEYSFSDDDFRLFMDYKLPSLRGIDEQYEYEFNSINLFCDKPNEDATSISNKDYNHEASIRNAQEWGVGYWRIKRK